MPERNRSLTPVETVAYHAYLKSLPDRTVTDQDAFVADTVAALKLGFTPNFLQLKRLAKQLDLPLTTPRTSSHTYDHSEQIESLERTITQLTSLTRIQSEHLTTITGTVEEILDHLTSVEAHRPFARRALLQLRTLKNKPLPPPPTPSTHAPH